VLGAVLKHPSSYSIPCKFSGLSCQDAKGEIILYIRSISMYRCLYCLRADDDHPRRKEIIDQL
jgi:hypothetical protein